jgi:hypothetical protein
VGSGWRAAPGATARAMDAVVADACARVWGARVNVCVLCVVCVCVCVCVLCL